MYPEEIVIPMKEELTENGFPNFFHLLKLNLNWQKKAPHW